MNVNSNPLPLSRFPFLATRDADDARFVIDKGIGGRRSIVPLSRGNSHFFANLLRLGPVGIIASSVSASAFQTEADGMIHVHLSCRGGLQLACGRSSISVPHGWVGIVPPGWDRSTSHSHGHAAIMLRIAPDALHQGMEAHGIAPGGDWSRLFISLPSDASDAQAFTRLVHDTVSTYDDPSCFPDRRADAIFGQSILMGLADLLASRVRRNEDTSRASYGIAARAEDVILRRFAEPLTLLDLVREVGANVGSIRRSMLLYRGLSGGEFLAYVRLLAAEEMLRLGKGSEEEVASLAGFPTLRSYHRAVHRRGELRARLNARGDRAGPAGASADWPSLHSTGPKH